MNRYCRALAAGVAAACLGGAAQANEATTYYYYDDGTAGAYSDSFAPSVRYYQSAPAVVAPAPRVYYAPAYTVRSNTTYYYSGSNHDHYSLSSPGYTTYHAPRIVHPAPVRTYYYSQPTYVAPAQPYGYVPPGLSITTPAGTYAPFYGGWNPYNSTENAGGYDAYLHTAY